MKKRQKVPTNTLIDELYDNHRIYVDSANRRSHPNVISGLKEVTIHILQVCIMYKYFTKTVKSAKVVGQVMGELHPHGDGAIYGAITNMLNPHDIRYPYLEGQGSFGSLDGDAPAAMRYTEMKISKFFKLLLDYTIYNNDDVTQSKLNYDGTLDEWKFLILPYSPILLNGTTGIGVGNATSIPPMNLYDIMKLYNIGIEFLKEILTKHKGVTLTDLLINPDCLSLITQFNFDYVLKKTGSNLIVPDFPVPININIYDATLAMIAGKGSFKYRANYRLMKDIDGYGIKAIEIIGIMFQNNGLAIKEKLTKYIADMGDIYDIKEFSDSKSMLNTDKLIYTIEFNNAKDTKVANKIANNIINSISGLSGNYNVNYKVMSDNGSTIVDTNPFYICITSLIRFIFSHKSDNIALYNKKMKEYYMKTVLYNAIAKHSITTDIEMSVLHSVIELVRNSDNVDEVLYEELDLGFCDFKHESDENYPTSKIVIDYIKNTPISKLKLLASEQFAEDISNLNEDIMGINSILNDEMKLIDYTASKYSLLEASLQKFNLQSVNDMKENISHKKVYNKIYKSLSLPIRGLLDRRSLPMNVTDEMDGDVVDESKKYTLFISTDNRTLFYEGHINITDIADKLNKSNIKDPYISKFTIHLHAGADLLLFTQNKCFRLKMDSNFINGNLRLINMRINNKDMLPLYNNSVNIKGSTEIVTTLVINEYPSRMLLMRPDDYGYVMELNKKKFKKDGIAIFSKGSINLSQLININKQDDRLLIHTASNKYLIVNINKLPTKVDGTLGGSKIVGGKNNSIRNIIPFSRKDVPFKYGKLTIDSDLIKKLTVNKLNATPKKV